MKSIREKAEEYTKDYFFSQVPLKVPNEHFEAGANYVLEEIVEFQRIFRNSMNHYADGYLRSMIEQLKK